MKEKSLEERAIEAVQDRHYELEKSLEQTAKNCYEQLKKEFPELILEGKYLILAGHKFSPYPTGTYVGGEKSGQPSYSLDPVIRRGHWVYDLASLGNYLIWYKDELRLKHVEKVSIKKRGFWAQVLDF